MMIAQQKDWSKTDPTGSIRDIVFRNIALESTATSVPPSEFLGFSAASGIHEITFENLNFNGKTLLSPEAAKLKTNAFVSGVRYVSTPPVAKQ